MNNFKYFLICVLLITELKPTMSLEEIENLPTMCIVCRGSAFTVCLKISVYFQITHSGSMDGRGGEVVPFWLTIWYTKINFTRF